MEYIEKVTDVSMAARDTQYRKLYCWAARRSLIVKPMYLVCLMMLFTQITELYSGWSSYGRLYEGYIIYFILLPTILYAAAFSLPYSMFIANNSRIKRTYGKKYVLKFQKDGYYINNVITPWNKAKKSLQCKYGIAQISYRGPVLLIPSNCVSPEEYTQIKKWMNF